uniref:RNase H type-1 domain-containing protein n=1 Tax=Aegilops tauschii subsp. strangulata TaxID=200361 RepID=A0A453GQT8_AEGTS
MWNKAGRSSIKVNVDASFCAETMLGATGAVARDDRGEFIVAATWFMPHVCTADSAKIHVVRNGIWLAQRIVQLAGNRI